MVQSKNERGLVMETDFYNLSGGINLALTKTELGIDTKKMYWSDSKNVEIYKNRGIAKQAGNSLLCTVPDNEEITGLHEMFYRDDSKLVITTISGKIYVYNPDTGTMTKLNKTLKGEKPRFASFLNGVLCITESDGLFYIKNDSSFSIVECNLKNSSGLTVTGDVLTVYKSRVWVASQSTIYYSALGSYTDFTTQNDAGYISDFHTDTAEITALKSYKDYLAIYKKNMVYLLTGTSPDDFAIVPFADRGTVAPRCVVNVDNKQYFLSSGIYALEQVGELNQIQLGSEISLKIKPEFDNLDTNKLSEAICVHYENKNQMWFFLPYVAEDYYKTIWINDYVNKAWYKRVVPQNITTAALFDNYVVSADNAGKVYREAYGSTFNGTPIDFMWKSPFLSIGSPHHRKVIDEFYFILDDAYDNNFNFSVYKDYDSQLGDDPEKIYSVHYDQLIWADDETSDNLPCHWAEDDADIPVWPANKDVLEKAEISEANYAVQLCVEGTEQTEDVAIIGLQFREIYNDD